VARAEGNVIPIYVIVKRCFVFFELIAANCLCRLPKFVSARCLSRIGEV
jgi:hypothetical protein